MQKQSIIPREKNGTFKKGYTSPKRNGILKICEICNKEFYLQGFRVKDKKRGKTCSVECGNKLRKGKHLSPDTEFKKGRPSNKPMLGKRHSEETKQKMSKAQMGKHKGELSPNWRGGLSFNPYPVEFNRTLKLKIRTRDNFICCLCGKTEREELEELNRVLCVNHIDFNKDNCCEKNLNTLCLRCNTKICRDRDYWTNYFI